MNAPAENETWISELGPERNDEYTKDHVGAMPGLSEDQVRVVHSLDVKGGIAELMEAVRRTDRTKFRSQVLAPLLDAGLVEMTTPEKPKSSKQQYRLTKKGWTCVAIFPSRKALGTTAIILLRRNGTVLYLRILQHVFSLCEFRKEASS